ncbi:MAG: helix-turn-helix domain-containing protein [Cyanophyceae cyanobacterium]
MLDRSVTVDFAQEKETGYRRIFSQLPLLSSLSTGWDGIYAAYDYLPPGYTPEVCSKQHSIAILVDLPTPAQAERSIDGQFRRERVAEGDILVIPAHTWNRSEWNVPGGAVLISFETAKFIQSADEAEISAELVPHFATPDPLVHQIGLALKGALTNYRPASRLYADTLTSTLIVHLLQHYSAQMPQLPAYSGGLLAGKLRQVVDYINAHLDQDLSLRELAAVTGISPHYFSQLFKQSTGVTPHQYVIRCRIERAKVLLKKLPISEVATEVGFSDQSHLHRHFKRLVGVTPKEFQQNS